MGMSLSLAMSQGRGRTRVVTIDGLQGGCHRRKVQAGQPLEDVLFHFFDVFEVSSFFGRFSHVLHHVISLPLLFHIKAWTW